MPAVHDVPDSAALDASRSPDALVALDADRRVVGVNHEFTRLVGFDADLALGSDFCDLCSPRDADGTPLRDWPPSARLGCVRAMPSFELDITHRGGRTLKTLAAARYVRRDGELRGAVLSLRDIGQRRLETAAAQAVATVSHELRAPLTGVRGFASLLLQRGGDIDAAQRHEMLEQIVAESERMSRLVAELLDVSRLEAGRMTFRVEDVDVAAACAAAAGTRDVGVSVPPGTRVSADRDKLVRILTNLVDNAFNYGRPPVTVSAAASAGTGAVEVVVADRGTIPAEALGRVFGKFWHRDAAGAGVGLGLYLARGLAAGMGGTLSVTSGAATGTRFTLALPASA